MRRIGRIGRGATPDTLASPPAPCPNCGKITRAKYRCPNCGKYWDTDESRQREVFKLQIFASNLKTHKALGKE